MRDLTPEQQVNQDFITALSNQRNAAQNECVQLAAALAAAQRAVAQLKKRLEALESPAETEKPVLNGHAERPSSPAPAGY